MKASHHPAYPRVSVIVCVYNGERYLEQAIESALDGMGENAELICLDDGSTDSTAKIARRFVRRVRYHFHPHIGLPAARNTGVALARGEFVAFLDADDILVRGRLACQLGAFQQNPALDIVFGHLKQFISPELSEDSRKAIQCATTAVPARVAGTMLMKKASFLRVGSFDESSQVAYFMEWYSRAVQAGLKVMMVPEVVVLRRIHTSNLGLTERSSFAEDHVRVIKGMLDRRRRCSNLESRSGKPESPLRV